MGSPVSLFTRRSREFLSNIISPFFRRSYSLSGLKRARSLVIGTAIASSSFLLPGAVSAQMHLQVLHSFGATNGIGQNPGPLVRDADGHFYGETTTGILGSNGFGGTLYSLDTNGANPQVLLKFGDIAGASSARSRMVAATDGNLYVWLDTVNGSSSGALIRVQQGSGAFQVLTNASQVGTASWQQMLEGRDGKLYAMAGTKLVKINKDGTGFQTIYTDPIGFTVSNDGAVSDQMLEGVDGMLYVSHFGGGTGNRGLIYKIDKLGTSPVTVLEFGTLAFELGSTPHQLIQGADGLLYGVAVSISSDGSFPIVGSPIFRMDTNGGNYTVLGRLQNYPMPGPGGTLREVGNASGFFEGRDGFLYGATQNGGTNRAGDIFRTGKMGGDFTVLTEFPDTYYEFDTGAGVSRTPGKFLIEGADRRIHGTARDNVLFRCGMDGSNFLTIFDFPNPAAEGGNPAAPLVLDADGTLYGTTSNGGNGNSGTLFKLKTNGSAFAYLHLLAGSVEGSLPAGGVVLSSNRLFGTCFAGGSSGVGTVFANDKGKTGFQVLKTFSTLGGDGRSPAAQLLEANDHSFYGTTYFGGGAAAGTIFRINRDAGGYSIIFRFTNNVSGANPSARLLQGADGALYGSAETNGPGGQGLVFALAQNNTGFRIVKSFSASAGSLRKPQGALLQGTDDFLYGTAAAGGVDGFGGVFKVSTNGTGYQVLHEFSATGADGRAPVAGLTHGPDGMLYGMTQSGGGSINGSIFRLNPDGTRYEKVYAFSGLNGTGGNPLSELIAGPDGTLYGTTSTGGVFNLGTVFRISFDTSGPELTIRSFGGGFELSWPEAGADFQLQFTSNVSNPNGWTSTGLTPVLSNGAYRVQTQPAQSSGFYRLVKP